MVYSEKHQFLFLSVPKTGSSSVQAALIDAGVGVRNQLMVDGRQVTVRDHITASELKAHFGAQWPKLWKVAMVRNPWDRYVSSYYYNKQGLCTRFVGQAKPWTYYPRVMASRCLPFKLWSLLYPIRSVEQFVGDATGKILIDQIYAYEHMEWSLQQITRRLGLPENAIRLPKMNVSIRTRDYTGYYDRLSRGQVTRRLGSEIRSFGYRFGSAPEQGCVFDASNKITEKESK